MAKHIQEELESFVEDGPKLLSSWAINKYLCNINLFWALYFGPSSVGFLLGLV